MSLKIHRMRTILIIGAGRSASSLIDYLLKKSVSENLHLILGDISLDLAKQKTNNHPNATAISLDIFDDNQRQKAIQKATIVISMLPAHLHLAVAKDCMLYKKNLVTASYSSTEMQKLNATALSNNLIIMNEMGLDPGIDHMSAMKIIDEIREKGGKITLFESFCGGLVAPESDTNLWNYKFTWAPRNVILAGQGDTAKFIQ
jgi:saccharopine dehydrogenase-like NADP-dependent oxidoreductase